MNFKPFFWIEYQSDFWAMCDGKYFFDAKLINGSWIVRKRIPKWIGKALVNKVCEQLGKFASLEDAKSAAL